MSKSNERSVQGWPLVSGLLWGQGSLQKCHMDSAQSWERSILRRNHGGWRGEGRRGEAEASHGGQLRAIAGDLPGRQIEFERQIEWHPWGGGQNPQASCDSPIQLISSDVDSASQTKSGTMLERCQRHRLCILPQLIHWLTFGIRSALATAQSPETHFLCPYITSVAMRTLAPSTIPLRSRSPFAILHARDPVREPAHCPPFFLDWVKVCTRPINISGGKLLPVLSVYWLMKSCQSFRAPLRRAGSPKSHLFSSTILTRQLPPSFVTAIWVTRKQFVGFAHIRGFQFT